MIYPSTFSIVGFDPKDGSLGIAVASKFPAVGSVVPWAEAKVGAVATQSFANTTYGPRGIQLLKEGQSPEVVLQTLISSDPERKHRQVGIVDTQGRSVTFTGKECFDWAGGVTGSGYAIQGNILAGEQVVKAMEQTFLATSGELPGRLAAALLAGDRAGGDRRGRQSAAIFVARDKAGYGGFNDRWIDYRVDDHPDPVKRLLDLLELHDLYFGKSEPGDRIPLTGETLKAIQTILIREGYYHGNIDGKICQEVNSAITAFIGNENFEDRVDVEKGLIDRPVYEYIQKKFGSK